MRAAARFYAWWKPRFCVASIADRMTSRVGWQGALVFALGWVWAGYGFVALRGVALEPPAAPHTALPSWLQCLAWLAGLAWLASAALAVASAWAPGWRAMAVGALWIMPTVHAASFSVLLVGAWLPIPDVFPGEEPTNRGQAAYALCQMVPLLLLVLAAMKLPAEPRRLTWPRRDRG